MNNEVTKLKKKDIINLTIITIFVLIVVLFCVIPNKMFGSVTDWGSQHTMLPEYFRTLFYQTKDLFPDFMMHLGAGQNIYNISYYGLLNPIVLLSYFFPFIKMVDFMIIMNIIIILLSIYLFYYWIKKKQFSTSTVMISTMIFTCAAPLIFHSHRHIMFITYMPFLMLGLIGIDRYFQKQKRTFITLGVLGMILTSYYYSIGGILVLVTYGIYSYLKQETKITFKKFMIDGIKFLYPIILGIGLSAILLLPTAYVIATGRNSANHPIELSKLLIPFFDINALVYSSYSIGLSALAIFGLFHTFFTRKKENIFIGIILVLILSIPIFMYILNGLLYVRSKVLIPFLPIFVFLIANFIKDVENKKINLKLEILVLILLAFFWKFRGYQQILFYIDFAICIIVLLIYQKWNKKWIYIIPITIFSICIVFIANKNENYQLKNEYQKAFHSDKQTLIKNTLSKDPTFFRFNDLTDTLLTTNKIYQNNYYTTSLYSSTYHQPYKDFFYNEIGNADTYRNRLVTSSSNNIFFQTLMNVKYVIAKKGEQPVGYQLIEQMGQYGVYQNDDVFPLGYATDQIYDQTFYKQLNYPYNIELLMHGTVVNGKGQTEFNTKIKKINIDEFPENNKLKVNKTKNGYKIVSKETTSFEVPLPQKIKDGEILIIKFKLKKSENCKVGDLSININNVSNKLTCKQWIYHNGNNNFEYALGKEGGMDHLSIVMSKGTFEIENIQYYILDYETIKNKTVDPFHIDRKKTKGDKIKGTINVKKDGYFTLSIPYDESFQIYVDGKKQNYEKVNQTFIGFPIKKGNHKIDITYEAPLKKVGLGISAISLLLLGIMIYKDKKIKNKI